MPTGPIGRLLTEVTDPFALKVHPPAQPEDAPPGLGPSLAAVGCRTRCLQSVGRR